MELIHPMAFNSFAQVMGRNFPAHAHILRSLRADAISLPPPIFITENYQHFITHIFLHFGSFVAQPGNGCQG
jgi:hypothetical protein